MKPQPTTSSFFKFHPLFSSILLELRDTYNPPYLLNLKIIEIVPLFSELFVIPNEKHGYYADYFVGLN
jgi:hypothetical protein